jgi:hypothetical protein
MKMKIFSIGTILSYVIALIFFAAAFIIPNMMCVPFGIVFMAVGLIFTLLYMKG